MAPAENVTWKKKRRIINEKANAAFILEHSNAVVFKCFRGKFRCAYCPIEFLNVADLRVHSTIHEKMDIFHQHSYALPYRVDITDLSCNLCNELVDNLDKLKEHLAVKHGKRTDPKYESFDDCIVPFSLGKDEFNCVICNEEFKCFMNLILHMNKHYQHFVCHICGKGYSGAHKLRNHQKSHEIGNFACTKCDSVFPNRVLRSRHVTVAHGPKERNRCPICNSTFTSYHARLRHLERVHDKKSEYPCNFCPAVFATGCLRNGHIRGVHEKKRCKKKRPV